jgi:hypothetical protein
VCSSRAQASTASKWRWATRLASCCTPTPADLLRSPPIASHRLPSPPISSHLLPSPPISSHLLHTSCLPMTWLMPWLMPWLMMWPMTWQVRARQGRAPSRRTNAAVGETKARLTARARWRQRPRAPHARRARGAHVRTTSPSTCTLCARRCGWQWSCVQGCGSAARTACIVPPSAVAVQQPRSAHVARVRPFVQLQAFLHARKMAFAREPREKMAHGVRRPPP